VVVSILIKRIDTAVDIKCCKLWWVLWHTY